MLAMMENEVGEMPLANTRPASARFDPKLFETIADVPVFAEHETEAKDGRKLRFSYNELKAVCDRCNRRINETGDYAGVTVGHTPDPDSDKDMPDLVGFAGPFKMGLLGEAGSRRRYAILADLHVYRDQLERVKRHPRRSPELWLEDRFEDMFLDPIALLGAEPPRLDMGLLYSANYQGRMTHKYTAVAPSSGSVFVSSIESNRRNYAAENQGDRTMLTPDDIGQIVDALEQLDWVGWVRQKIEEERGNNSSMGGPDGPPREQYGDLDDEPAAVSGFTPPRRDAPPASRAPRGAQLLDEPLRFSANRCRGLLATMKRYSKELEGETITDRAAGISSRITPDSFTRHQIIAKMTASQDEYQRASKQMAEKARELAELRGCSYEAAFFELFQFLPGDRPLLATQ